MQFLNALSPWQWAAAAAVPIGVVALYFLKLRRKPVQVPSTYLWQKSVEDLHVNALFQRLRRNLLLFLQLLVLALALLALARPAWLTREVGGQRHVILVDNSASMAAGDVAPSRLEWAKAQARSEVIDKMASDDLAMIISFNDAASVVASYTGNRQVLRDRLAAIAQTQRPTDLREALEVAAGLANPQKLREGVAETAPPKLHVFSDGRFPEVNDFSLGNLDPHFYAVGNSDVNLGILAMMVRRNEEHPDRMQVFARIENFSAQPMTARSELYLDGELKDAQERRFGAHGDASAEQAVAFDLDNLERGVLELRLDAPDALALDNRAWAVVGDVRRARVLAVTPGNRWLEITLRTAAAAQLADTDFIKPDAMGGDDYQQKAATGHYDLVIFDGCAPDRMPESNTLFFGAIPKLASLGAPRTLERPLIAEVNDTHPLMRYVNLENVIILESLLPELPPGTETLIESGDGPLAFVLTREGFSDCVFGFGFERQTPQGQALNTDWPLRLSFPMFVLNALRVLGNVEDAISEKAILPGQTVALRSDAPVRAITVRDPAGQSHQVARNAQGTFVFNATDQAGVYQFTAGGQETRRFAVNLFDPRESDIAPKEELQIGHNAIEASHEINRAQREYWRWLVLAAFAVLLLEWYIYNRRVYV